jgi:hypothetical protein
MIKRLQIDLGKGNLETGFQSVNIQLYNEYGALEYGALGTCSLPSAKKVSNCYQEWKSSFQKFYKQFRSSRAANKLIEFPQSDSNVKPSDINSQYKKLKDAINNWLDTENFCVREKELRTKLNENDEIMVIISTEDDLVWRLPWHLWRFFDHYRNAGVVLSHPEFKKVKSNSNDLRNLKVLAIVDNAFDSDLKHWEEIKGIDLKSLSGDEILNELGNKVSEEEILQKISTKLDEQPWNILFFTGHSSSKTNGDPQFLIIRDQWLRFNKLENPLRKAIEQGLQLAIFNSCDGLGIARKLLTLNIPKVIVMREDVPSGVAQEFLKYFLEEFIKNKGKPAFLVVRRATEKLQGWEEKFPGASLLPVMCSNPATQPLVIPPSPLCLLLKRIFPWLAIR